MLWLLRSSLGLLYRDHVLIRLRAQSSIFNTASTLSALLCRGVDTDTSPRTSYMKGYATHLVVLLETKLNNFLLIEHNAWKHCEIRAHYSFTVPCFAGVLFCTKGIFRNDCWKQVLTYAVVTDIDFRFHGIDVSLISYAPVHCLEHGQLDKTVKTHTLGAYCTDRPNGVYTHFAIAYAHTASSGFVGHFQHCAVIGFQFHFHFSHQSAIGL